MCEFEKKLHRLYDNVETKFRPDVRWWLAEGLNTDETLKKNVRLIKEYGFGAAEFLAVPEPNADSTIYGWGSEEWTSDSRLIVKEATDKGLGFSLTSGAHWSNANLPDTYIWKGEPYCPDSKAAAKELDYSTIILCAGERFSGELPIPKKIPTVWGYYHGSAKYNDNIFQAVVSAKLIEKRQNSGQDFDFAQGDGVGMIDFSSLTDLTLLVKETNGKYTLDWTAPDDGQYILLSYWMHGTCQIAEPSVSTNYTINYVDRYGVDALIDYWEEVVLTDDLRKTIRQNGRGEIYMDSLELITFGAGGLFWGYDFLKEFMDRKGYSIVPYLPFLTLDCVRTDGIKAKVYDYRPDKESDIANIWKIRMDYYDVLSCMYLENVLRPLQCWLHSLGMTLRAEPSYGMPYEISTPAKYIDGIETESFAQLADIDLFRGMSGAAHMYGRKFSSETGAVMHRNYYFNMDAWTQLCYLQLAQGVNRIVFHGYSAIEGADGDTIWPGHEGMAAIFSERFSSRQPASLHYPAWTKMLGRIQKAMRRGSAVRDLAILRTDYAFINYGQPEGYDNFTCNYSMHGIPYYFQDLSLQQKGYTYDYFSPLLLLDDENVCYTASSLQPNGPDYRAILIYQEMLELPAAKKLLDIAKAGLPIIFVNNNKEILFHDGTEYHHKQAASMSRSFSDSDDALRNVVASIKALPNVKTAGSPADVIDLLSELGISPRAGYMDPNDRLLTMTRLDRAENTLYAFTHSYKFELCKGEPAVDYTLELDGEGTPYAIDIWTGDIKQLPHTYRNRKTCITLNLAPGECSLIALDLSATSPEQAKTETIPVEIINIDRWDIEIEDWNEGDKIVNTEEKFGHTTTEVYYTTKKTCLSFNDQIAVPWKDLPASKEQLKTLAGEEPSMAHVSGIGRYTANFTLPEDFDATLSALLKLEDAGGGSVMIDINGKILPIDLRSLTLDIGKHLVPGKNTLKIEVASTLTNRMIQRGYDKMDSGWDKYPVSVQGYGLNGAVSITLCRKL